MAKIEFAAKNEYTEKYDDFVLGRLVNGNDRELLYIKAKVVNVDDEDVLVAEPYAREGSQVKPFPSIWSRNCVTPEDREALKSFRPVDAIVRFGTYTDEKTGEQKAGAPKLIALLDSNRQVMFLTGAKREFHGEE